MAESGGAGGRLRTPVVLIIFNRPETTARVFAAIAAAKPATLFVIADGPRANRPEDAARCAAARAVTERIDWRCQVVRDYSAVNLGCGRRPATGISRVFEQAEEAIILEDDCLPDPTFFRFCAELLERYRDDTRIMHVAAFNDQRGRVRSPYSYFFSYHVSCWGWATWRRAWRHFDAALGLWPLIRESSLLEDILEHPRAVAHFRSLWDRAHSGRGDVSYWDYQWSFACWSQNGLAVLPNRTLVSNIGFGHGATHTRSTQDALARRYAEAGTEAMEFPLRHPPYVRRFLEADRFIVQDGLLPTLPPPPSLLARCRARCRGFLDEHPSLSSPRALYRRLHPLRGTRLRRS